jgi:hypothetical protein
VKWCRAVWSILHWRDTEPTELLSAGLMLAWGAIVMLPGSAALSGVSFRLLEQIVPQDVWGIAYLVAGMIGLHGAASEHESTRYGWRRLGTFLQAVLWMVLAVLTIISNSWAPAWLFYGGMFLAAGWAYLRLTWRNKVNGSGYGRD